MSKNLTRKGLAFGAIVALGSSLLAGAPANADNNGPITLLPDGGTVATATNNTIIGAGLTMTSEQLTQLTLRRRQLAGLLPGRCAMSIGRLHRQQPQVGCGH